MLEKRMIGEHMTVTPDGVILLRRVEGVFENGVQIAETNFRTSFTPDQDTGAFAGRLKQVADAVWDTGTKALWEEKKAAEAAKDSGVEGVK